MPNEEKAKESIYVFLKETSNIFDLLKKYSILIEEKLPEHKAPVHAANELKSLVFHLYNTVSFPEHVDINILEAKEHLCRAFYDLHNVAISIYIEGIKDTLNTYKTTTVANAFPEYGNTIRPEIRVIQEQLREIRTNRNTDITLLNSDINTFSEQVKALARFDDIVESMKPVMNKYDEEKKEEEDKKDAKERQKRNRDKIWDLVKILIGAAVGALITLFVTNKNSTNKSQPSTNPTEQHTKDTLH